MLLLLLEEVVLLAVVYSRVLFAGSKREVKAGFCCLKEGLVEIALRSARGGRDDRVEGGEMRGDAEKPAGKVLRGRLGLRACGRGWRGGELRGAAPGGGRTSSGDEALVLGDMGGEIDATDATDEKLCSLLWPAPRGRMLLSSRAEARLENTGGGSSRSMSTNMPGMHWQWFQPASMACCLSSSVTFLTGQRTPPNRMVSAPGRPQLMGSA